MPISSIKRRTPLKRQKQPLKPHNPIKTSTGLKRKSKTPEAKLKAKLWELCREITRARYRNKDGSWNCYTCGKRIDEPAKAQTGHFIPSSTCGAFLRYELRNLRIQDYYCNINLGGNGSSFYRMLVQEMGQEYVDQLFRDKQRIVKANASFYEDLIEKYTEILSKLHDLSPISTIDRML